jgi:hypothetical protein
MILIREKPYNIVEEILAHKFSYIARCDRDGSTVVLDMSIVVRSPYPRTNTFFRDS